MSGTEAPTGQGGLNVASQSDSSRFRVVRHFSDRLSCCLPPPDHDDRPVAAERAVALSLVGETLLSTLAFLLIIAFSLYGAWSVARVMARLRHRSGSDAEAASA